MEFGAAPTVYILIRFALPFHMARNDTHIQPTTNANIEAAELRATSFDTATVCIA